MPPRRPKLINSLIRVPHVGQRVRFAHDTWLRLNLNKRWQSQNSHAQELFNRYKPNLTSLQKRVLSDLNNFGIAKVHFNELFVDRQLWDQLSATLHQWLNSREVKDKERAYLEEGYSKQRWKEYIVMMCPEEAALPWDSPLLRFGVASEILDIVNSYFGMMTRLLYADMWSTIPIAHDRPLTGSQRWHRDPEDVKITKVFFYLADVHLTSGPLHYVRNSRKGEKYGHLWPQQLPYGNVAPPEALEAAVPRSDWEVCAYPAGTIVFIDTTGLHMGGRSTNGQRVFATWAFVSHAAPWSRTYDLVPSPTPQELSVSAKIAFSQKV
jgi:hypothetical protein